MTAVQQDKFIFPNKDFPIFLDQKQPNPTPVSLWHETLELKYVLYGSITMMIDTEAVTASTGEIILINPFEAHSNLVFDDCAAAYQLFMLDLDFFAVAGSQSPDLRALLVEQNIRFSNLISDQNAGEILQKIALEVQNKGPYFRLAVTGLLQELVAVLLRQHVCESRQMQAFGDRIRFYKSVEPAVLMLRDQYGINFSGPDLADACGLTHSHFCRIFKRAIGMTPVQYQTECRLRIADILLKNAGLSISQIAARVGFQDEAYFSRAYKKSRGIAPSFMKAKLSK